MFYSKQSFNDRLVNNEDVAWVKAYKSLKAEIINGHFLPGMKLVERDLSNKLGASRSSIRTALHLLSAEGLVDLVPRVGARVAVISYEEALETTAVREVLEGLAARLTAIHASKEVCYKMSKIIPAMKEAIQKEDFLGYSYLNEELHDLIVVNCRNAKLQRALDSVMAQLLQHRMRGLLMPGRATASLIEHEKIAFAIINHNPEAAESATREHIRNVYKALESRNRYSNSFLYKGIEDQGLNFPRRGDFR